MSDCPAIGPPVALGAAEQLLVLVSLSVLVVAVAILIAYCIEWWWIARQENKKAIWKAREAMRARHVY